MLSSFLWTRWHDDVSPGALSRIRSILGRNWPSEGGKPNIIRVLPLCRKMGAKRRQGKAAQKIAAGTEA
jgi:hypothetical protein